MPYHEKRCDLCGKIGPAYTWGITICNECFLKMPNSIFDAWKEIYALRDALGTLYGYLLQADRDGESIIPQELGVKIEKLLEKQAAIKAAKDG